MKTQAFKITLLLFVFSCTIVKNNMAAEDESKLMTTKVELSAANEIEMRPFSNFQNSNNQQNEFLEQLTVIEETNISTDEELTIESWMINDQLFRFEHKISTAVEEPLSIESWMTDDERWKL